ncbi:MULTISPECIES: hypothetical protein [unclassified Cryobacterium]|uniref:hypothetical protein n=1 Tax=unclassified Cryobacterium TaxID=2649013 RepID=UPI00106A1609|nr:MULTISPECIES: hypothetical protein [unclassified Cryobacterium]TFC59463.1 hypothetical protein E3O68_00760 [Cryobacterium sp. TMB3-1-2]TFC67259.1 hypothetical protein E3T21_17455 [Cryobacterium sp. TMB3-15]TFC73228.1 hypothetical protein E3T22_16600 [Cryobacterium sp. TMB3-10]TFD46116.1 hypothetical protein E3T58_01235 [Cryobacterium sp. TMB3-12]
MSNTARKARKRAGIKFEKAAKVGTPVMERAWFALANFDAKTFEFRPRSAKKIKRALEHRTV